MNCERFREHLIEFADGRLDEPAAALAREHLDRCESCRRELAELRETLLGLDAIPSPRPSPRLRARVLSLVEEEKRALRSPLPRTAAAPPRRLRLTLLWQTLAACGLVAIGFMAGARRAPAPAPAPDAATQRELADLRRRVDSMGQLVSYSLIQQQQRSTNDRLERVLASAAAPRQGENAVGGLITSLALDSSVNVRLSALEALYAYRDQDVVRTSVLVSLPRETSPLVQIAMIDFLVSTRERDAAAALQKLSANETVDRNVREAAQRGLTQL